MYLFLSAKLIYNVTECQLPADILKNRIWISMNLWDCNREIDDEGDKFLLNFTYIYIYIYIFTENTFLNTDSDSV
jgi:hypothetical protein